MLIWVEISGNWAAAIFVQSTRFSISIHLTSARIGRDKLVIIPVTCAVFQIGFKVVPSGTDALEFYWEQCLSSICLKSRSHQENSGLVHNRKYCQIPRFNWCF